MVIAVRALLFDVMGTVVDWHGGVVAGLETWGAARGISADWAKFCIECHAAFPPLRAEVNTGKRAWANFDELLREALESQFPKLGLTELNQKDLDELVALWHAMPPWPDSVAAMQRLRRRYILSTLSNAHVAMLIDMAKAAGLPWDAIVGVDLFHRYKPAPETYLGATALLGCQPGQVMLVASHPYDLAAAAKCGLRTCYVSRPLEYGAGIAFEAPPKPGQCDLIVGDLGKLADLMEC